MAEQEAGRTDDAVDISEYLRRALKVQADRQGYYIPNIISAEDLAAMRRTATILMACAAIAGPGVPAGMLDASLELAEGILWHHAQFSDLERNWTE